MDPNVWGPGAWTFLHSVTLNYPKKPNYLDKQRYSQFFHNLQFVLPCPICQEHYQSNVRNNPIKLDSRDELVAWLVDIHNQVNRKNGKKMWSLNEFYKKYQQMYAVDSQKTNYNRLVVCVIIILLIVILFMFLRGKKQPPF